MKLVDWKNLNAEQKYIWNKAIEAAALEADNVAGSMSANAIRKLKK